MDTRIKRVHARHLVDCKCRGLLEVDVITEDGTIGTAAAPTGTSVGENEAYVMRDKPPARFLGTSVYSAVDVVENVIGPVMVGVDVTDQAKIDQILLDLDDTPLKKTLGGNSIFGVSFACAMAAAKEKRVPFHRYLNPGPVEHLPLPVINMFNGGHYGNIHVQVQEFGVIPYGAEDMQEAVEIGIVMFDQVGKLISSRTNGEAPGIANYFGHKPISNNPIELYEIIAEAAEICRYTDKVMYASDFAASEFYDPKRGTYTYMGKEMDRDELLGEIENLISRFNFYSVEDVLEEHDFEGFAIAAQRFGDVRIVGDDLICTNKRLLEKALKTNCCDGIIFKPNQIGTLSECLETFHYACENNVMVIPSVRAGGTIDDPVKSMAIAMQAPLCKCGAPRSGERVSFLNTLLRAADEFPEARFYQIKDLKRAVKRYEN